MKGKYFHDVSIVRPGGEDTVPHPEKDEVVVYCWSLFSNAIYQEQSNTVVNG
jgi:hypothetical protein